MRMDAPRARRFRSLPKTSKHPRTPSARARWWPGRAPARCARSRSTLPATRTDRSSRLRCTTGSRVFLISRIAEHTRNLAADARASLLVHEIGKADPLANGRVTLIGPCARRRATSARARAVRAGLPQRRTPMPPTTSTTPTSTSGASRLEAVRFIGGYGRMSWVAAEEFRSAAARSARAAPPRASSTHMNQDHADALLALRARLHARARRRRRR